MESEVLAMLAEWLVGLAAAYAVAGALFAVIFLIYGVDRIDPAARHAGVGFRLIILPGVVALWPLLARRWLGGAAHPPVERTPHRAREARR